MNKILFIYTKRSETSAEYIRVKYLINSLEEMGLNVVKYEVRSNNIRKYLNYLTTLFPFINKWFHHIKDFDLVITTNPPVLNAIIGYEIALRSSKPLVVDIRDIWEEYVKTTRRLVYTPLVLNRIINKYYRAIKYASLITVTTDKILDYYRRKLNINQIHVVPNGVDPVEIKCSGLEEKKYDLVYLADFNYPYHALEILINVIKNSDLRLLVIGGGKYLDKVKKYIVKNNIRVNIDYTGFIPHNELSKYLCIARIGVSGRPFINNPEFLYTIPVKIYEYLGAGLPVLAYGPSNSAVEEFIQKYNIGYYIDRFNTDLFLDKIHDLVTKHRDYFYKCTSIAKLFDRRIVARNFAKLISNLLSTRAK